MIYTGIYLYNMWSVQAIACLKLLHEAVFEYFVHTCQHHIPTDIACQFQYISFEYWVLFQAALLSYGKWFKSQKLSVQKGKVSRNDC